MQIFSHAVPTQRLPQLHPPEAGSVGGALIGRAAPARTSVCVFMQERRVVWICCVDCSEVYRPSCSTARKFSCQSDGLIINTTSLRSDRKLSHLGNSVIRNISVVKKRK